MRLCTPSVCLSVPLGTVSPKPKLTETSNLAKMFPRACKWYSQFLAEGSKVKLRREYWIFESPNIITEKYRNVENGLLRSDCNCGFPWRSSATCDSQPSNVRQTVHKMLKYRDSVPFVEFRCIWQDRWVAQFLLITSEVNSVLCLEAIYPPAWIINKRIILAM